MAKQIHLHCHKTGRIRRFAHYGDLRAAACAKALLDMYGWNTSKIKHNPMSDNPYYVYSEVINHRPTINQYTLVTGSIEALPRRVYYG